MFAVGIIFLPGWLANISIGFKFIYLFVGVLPLILPLSTAILVGCLCFTASIMLDNIATKKRHCKKSDLMKWRESYSIIGELFDSINHCFGPTLVILVTTCFVRMVNHFFGLIASFRDGLKNSIEIIFAVHGLLVLFFVFLHFIAICYVGYMVRRQVGYYIDHSNVLYKETI